jgi:hypothetical protein
MKCVTNHREQIFKPKTRSVVDNEVNPMGLQVRGYDHASGGCTTGCFASGCRTKVNHQLTGLHCQQLDYPLRGKVLCIAIGTVSGLRRGVHVPQRRNSPVMAEVGDELLVDPVWIRQLCWLVWELDL